MNQQLFMLIMLNVLLQKIMFDILVFLIVHHDGLFVVLSMELRHFILRCWRVIMNVWTVSLKPLLRYVLNLDRVIVRLIPCLVHILILQLFLLNSHYVSICMPMPKQLIISLQDQIIIHKLPINPIHHCLLSLLIMNLNVLLMNVI